MSRAEGGRVRVGTASWTDAEFIKAGWYPPDVKGDAEAQLRYYAARFPMVEVNSSFYALPTVETTAAWADRTPDGFRFHVKAHQVISGHPSEPGRLPPPLRELPATYDAKGRIRRPSRELRDAVIDSLLEAVGPLGDKLGAILVQLPPYVVSGDRQRDELAHILERLRPARAAVEFRHRSWAEPGEREAAADLLGAHEASWVVVDAPRIDAKNVMPPIVEVTSPSLAYLRLHGRNAATWNTGRTVAERFDHVYSEQEMEEWLDPVLEMAERAQEVAVVFNNNARDYALRNAAEFARDDFRCKREGFRLTAAAWGRCPATRTTARIGANRGAICPGRCPTAVGGASPGGCTLTPPARSATNVIFQAAPNCARAQLVVPGMHRRLPPAVARCQEAAGAATPENRRAREGPGRAGLT